VDRVNDEILVPPIEPSVENGPAGDYDYIGLKPQPTRLQASVLESIDVAWLLWRERRFLIRLTTAGFAAFLILALILPKRYTATVQLMPPDFNTSSDIMMALPALSSGGGERASGGGGGGTGSLMGMASKLLGFNSSADLFTGVLKSRTVEDEIVNRFELMKLYRLRYPEDGRWKLEHMTEIKVEPKTGILSLSVEDQDPARAAAMAQAYVEALNNVLAKVNNSTAHRERLFIEHRREEVKKELDEAAKEFSEFSSKNTAIDIPEQAKAMVAAAADLQAQLIAAQSMLSGLQQIYTENNPRVREMEAQVAELERQLNKVGGKGITPANGSVLSTDELYPSIRQLPLLGVRYIDLYRRSKIDEAVYELLTKQYEIARLEEARDVPTAQVLDAATVPQKKSGPKRTFIVLGGTFFSFASGITWLLASAYWKRTDPQLPWKVFAQEVFQTCKRKIERSKFGHLAGAMLGKFREFIVRKREEQGKGSVSDLS
jgi:capsule polysaccharide export protein KpsE/RkpR